MNVREHDVGTETHQNGLFLNQTYISFLESKLHFRLDITILIWSFDSRNEGYI